MDLGSTVTLVYTGKLEDGTVFGYATEENPMVFQTGMDMTIDGFEKEILAMEGFEGDNFYPYSGCEKRGYKCGALCTEPDKCKFIRSFGTINRRQTGMGKCD